MNKVRILIVEDEVLVAMDLSNRLTQAGYEVTDRVETGEAALEALKNSLPDLVLLDIRLSGEMDGIQVAGEIKASYRLPVIFLTSFADDSTFRKAQQMLPSAYILKPFQDRELFLAIELAISNFAHYRSGKDEKEPEKDSFYLLDNSLFLKHRTRFEKVPFEEITYFQAEGNCTLIHTSEKKYFLSTTLGLILQNLNAPHIVRTHRSFAVNLRKVSAFEGNMLFINELSIPVSQAHKSDVFSRFHTL